MDNHPVITQINKSTECTGYSNLSDIPVLINQLGASNGFIRMQARETLICIGKIAVPDLTKALSNPNVQLRWQVIKVLEGILDPSTVPALVEYLKDENAGIRWASAEALIKFNRTSLPALLKALVHESDSIWLRQSAHHILRVLKESGRLNQIEENVYEALEDVEPSIAVPWAAQKALETLR